MYNLGDSSILITGGTGSLGTALIRELLENTEVRRIAIYSRDELKQQTSRNIFNDDKRLRWFIGDIRDKSRLIQALHGVDYVIHAAAMKPAGDDKDLLRAPSLRALFAKQSSCINNIS